MFDEIFLILRLSDVDRVVVAFRTSDGRACRENRQKNFLIEIAWALRKTAARRISSLNVFYRRRGK